MKKQKKYLVVLIIVLALFFAVNYHFADKYLAEFFDESKTVAVERVVDGDTIKIGYRESVRLLGINSPEKGEMLFEEAKDYLEGIVLNETVRLEFGKEKYDKYNRILAYVFLEEKNVNLEMVEKGFANYYFPSGRDKNYPEFKSAWEKCIENEVNLCKPSNDLCSDCIRLISRSSIKNNCNFNCNLSGWSVRAEGREIIEMSETLQENQEAFFELNLNEQDTLFLRDSQGGLVDWADAKIISNAVDN